MRPAHVGRPCAPGDAELRLCLVGSFEVYRSGRPQAPTEVSSRKGRTLLALLAVEQGRLVGIDRVVEVLWDGAPPLHPAENVATLVSRLRTRLGPEVITGGRSGYRLGDMVSVDLYEGAALVTEACRQLVRGEHRQALTTIERALELLDGDVLEGESDASWPVAARSVHGESLRRARYTAAEAALQLGNITTAQAFAEAAVVADPLDESASRALMRAYAAGGEQARALAAYERLRTALATELGVDPARTTRDLHLAILQDRLTLAREIAHVTELALSAPPVAVPEFDETARQTTDASFVRRHGDVARFVEAWAHAAAADERFLQPVMEALVRMVAGVAGLPAGTLAGLSHGVLGETAFEQPGAVGARRRR
jgi:DNA-binding SARP family transcriptional activator